MTATPVPENLIFRAFEASVEITDLASDLGGALANESHPLCRLAAAKLQAYLQEQDEWVHNFGLLPHAEGIVIGKMFGILVVRTKELKLGYIAAFSGKLAGQNHLARFVPPIFDGLEPGGFLNAGMERLSQMSAEISGLESLGVKSDVMEIQRLKNLRRKHSNALQDRIFKQYHFLNQKGESKSLMELFKLTPAGKPSAGAGECAAPKLLQYAFQNGMQPLGLAEFWWGLSPKSAHWKHGQFYAPCREKCSPILAHMLV